MDMTTVLPMVTPPPQERRLNHFFLLLPSAFQVRGLLCFSPVLGECFLAIFQPSIKCGCEPLRVVYMHAVTISSSKEKGQRPPLPTSSAIKPSMPPRNSSIEACMVPSERSPKKKDSAHCIMVWWRDFNDRWHLHQFVLASMTR